MTEPWSFGICVGRDTAHLDGVVASIEAQQIPQYEIILCTEDTTWLRQGTHIRTVHVGTDRPNWITKKKNVLACVARYENLCLLHDYAALTPGWYEAFEEFGSHWDVCCMPVLCPDGERWWDWGRLDPHGPLPYSCQGKKNEMYVSGTAFCVKRTFLCDNPFDESLSHGEAEDAEWSRRVRDKWRLELNQESKIHLLRNPGKYQGKE